MPYVLMSIEANVNDWVSIMLRDVSNAVDIRDDVFAVETAWKSWKQVSNSVISTMICDYRSNQRI